MERKEAIEVIKKNWPDSSFTMLREALETLIPELKESEDERIRKEIVNFICWAIDRGSITSEQREKSNSWIAWLEKQGKQKHVFPKFRVDDTVKAKTMDNFMFTIKDITDKQYVDTNGGKYDIEGQDYLKLVEPCF